MGKTSDYFTIAKSLDQTIKDWQTDGGQWRKVEFYTKSCTNDVFTGLKNLDGLANVAIFKPEVHEKHLTVEQPPNYRSNR